ncbi:growth-regulating factor 3-like [Olea europaea var. sylvestris]|uniref:growth-regulating factor 3-like n=1 Tax=Olea europaea var. sylvestris TaxID=158386 RepID=UPI000C1CF55D|nr:growth-regulating factor 3-like [Olea europaea var. sylvestris]
MEFNLKKWRERQQESEEEEPHSAKLPRLLLDPHPLHQQHSGSSAVLPLFVPAEPTTNLSAYHSDATNKFPRMESTFSLAQWQEVELQALIFRHMLAGAVVPPQLLHLLKKSLITSPSPYLFSQQSCPHYQTTLLRTGYWGRGTMDPEPGRCRRTDGKKWRCSREVVTGQRYCERHIHRGRNRSRKPVENSTSEVLKTTSFTLSRPSPSMDLLHLNQRPSESIIVTKGPSEANSDCKSDGQTLRHFFNEWSRQETGNAASPVATATNLSISIAENPSSDFSLKLATGDTNDSGPQVVHTERDRHQLNWGATWRTNPVAAMGGPLAEALRSSTFPDPN